MPLNQTMTKETPAKRLIMSVAIPLTRDLYLQRNREQVVDDSCDVDFEEIAADSVGMARALIKEVYGAEAEHIEFEVKQHNHEKR